MGLFRPASFDAVLLLVPLYHLTRADDRHQALSAAVRCGGRLFAAFITVYAPIRDGTRHYPEQVLDRRGDSECWLDPGIHEAAAPDSGFTTASFIHPAGVRPLVEPLGIRTLRLAGSEGLVSNIDDRLNQLQGPAWEAWVDLTYRCGSDPCLLGAAEHLLHVGEKV